jgi:hypothetical protein
LLFIEFIRRSWTSNCTWCDPRSSLHETVTVRSFVPASAPFATVQLRENGLTPVVAPTSDNDSGDPELATDAYAVERSSSIFCAASALAAEKTSRFASGLDIADHQHRQSGEDKTEG